MKKMIIVLALMFAGFFASETKAGYGDVNFNFFYHSLRSQGEWIEIDYDVVVWRPYNTDRSWAPYSVGNWEYTSYGWYWNSYEPFGWATYHYGRWYNDDYYGWVWVPGNEWGPSWVEWRYSDSYIGWAPLPPYADYRNRVGIYFSVNYRTSYHYWNFVSYNRFCDRNVYMHYVDYNHKNRVFNNTKYRTNYYSDRGRIINGGVDRNIIERNSGRRVVEREVERTTDLRNYTGSRGDANSNRVVSYQPEDREIQSYRNTEVKDISRSSGKSSLKRENVTFRNEETKSREVVRNDDKSPNREVSRNNVPKVDNRSRNDSYSRPVITREKETKTVPQRNTVNERKVNEPKSYRTPVKVEPKVNTYKPSNPAKKQNEVYRAPKNNTRNNSSVSQSKSQPRQKSVSRPSTNKREVSKSTSRSSSTKKKRN